MTLATRFNTAACAAVLVGSLTFCLADERPILALIIVPIVIVGWVCGMGEWGRPDGQRRPIALPRLLVNLLVVAAIINAAMRAGGARTVGQPIVSHLGEFLIYVQLLKLFDRHNVRDESQLLTLSVFVIIAASLTSNNLLTGVGIVLFTPLAISATMLYQLRAGQARAAEGRAASASVHGDGDADLKRGFSRQLVQTVWLCVLTAGFLGAIIFVVTPRGLGVGALGQFGQPHQMVGFNDHIDLGRSGLLSESSMPVIDLALQDESGTNIGSPYRMVYLRGFTRDEYDSTSHIWVRSKTAPTTLTFKPGSRTVLPLQHADSKADENEPRSTARLVQRITIRPSISGESYVFGAWRPTSVQTTDPTSGTLTYDLLDGTIRRPKSAHATFTYTLESSEIQTKSDLLPESAFGFQEGPVHDLAWSILEANQSKWPEDPAPANVRSVANLFRDHLSKNYTYTLDLWAADEGRDPLEMFLFEKRTGHCQYFASAMTAMLQAVGIHARVVGGFVAADYNSLTGTYIVRQSNAHAWVEVHTGQGAWTRYDPTPTADLDRIHRAAGGWLSAVRRWWDTLEFGWNRSIVSFDTDRLSASAGRGDPSGISAWFARISDRLVRGISLRDLRTLIPDWAFYIVPAIMLILTLAFVTGRLSRTRLARLVRRHPRERDPQLRALLNDAGFYGQALRALERRGGLFAKPDDRPPLAHAELIELVDPIVAEPFRSIASIYYAVRFGRTTLTPEQASAGRDALSRLKEALKRPAPPPIEATA